MKGLTESSEETRADALATFITGDNARALVTMGELAQFKQVHHFVFAKFQQGSVQRNDR